MKLSVSILEADSVHLCHLQCADAQRTFANKIRFIFVEILIVIFAVKNL